MSCRDWVVDKGLYNYPTTCKDPERLSDKMWDVVQSSEFACKVIMSRLRNRKREKKSGFGLMCVLEFVRN